MSAFFSALVLISVVLLALISHCLVLFSQIAAKFVDDSRAFMATAEPTNLVAAISLLDSALALQPRSEAALELKARCLLRLRRFRDVAEMLHFLIPSLQSTSPDVSPEISRGHRLLCFPSPEPEKKVPLCQWRHAVLGQACFHLGMLDDAMALLQTARRRDAAASRRESRRFSRDKVAGEPSSTASPAPAELSHIRLLLRRRAAAVCALDAGHVAESARQFSKILDGRRGIPCAFAAGCLLGRAAAYRAAGRVAEAIGDCNQALSLDPSSIPALRARADLLESVGCYAECLRDLDHLKLLSDAILRHGDLPGPAWRRRRGLNRCEMGELAARIEGLRRRSGGAADYHALLGVQRGCSRSELERAHRILSLRHKAERAGHFVERMVFADEGRDVEAVREQAKMSAMLLCRLLQKAFSGVMAQVKEEEEEEEARKKEKVKQELLVQNEAAAVPARKREDDYEEAPASPPEFPPAPVAEAAAAAVVASVFRGVFCRDLAVVGNLLSQAGLHRAIPVKYEALTC